MRRAIGARRQLLVEMVTRDHEQRLNGYARTIALGIVVLVAGIALGLVLGELLASLS